MTPPSFWTPPRRRRSFDLGASVPFGIPFPKGTLHSVDHYIKVLHNITHSGKPDQAAPLEGREHQDIATHGRLILAGGLPNGREGREVVGEDGPGSPVWGWGPGTRSSGRSPSFRLTPGVAGWIASYYLSGYRRGLALARPTGDYAELGVLRGTAHLRLGTYLRRDPYLIDRLQQSGENLNHLPHTTGPSPITIADLGRTMT